MDLYVLRHGQAVEAGAWRGAEADRPLTEAGRAEMRDVARGLRWLDLKLDVIYTSPLARAHETANIAAAALDLAAIQAPALAPGYDPDQLATLLAAHTQNDAVMIVGHEPDLSTLIGQLIAVSSPTSMAMVTMKKASCAALRLHENKAKLAGRGELRWLLTAKQLSRLGAQK